MREDSKAVIARSFSHLSELASSDRALHATFYHRVNAPLVVPEGDKWDRLREVADTALFYGYHTDVRFAALVLNGRGLTSYGSCELTLRTSMIEYRASVFEENSGRFVEKNDIPMWRASEMPRGYRATWEKRGQLAVVKLHTRLQDTTSSAQFTSLITEPGPTTEEDQFIEVHIYGPMTVRTFERVRVNSSETISAPELLSLEAKLSSANVALEVY